MCQTHFQFELKPVLLLKDPSKTFLTATNDNGTPMYMAPEQFNGSHLDEKVDVYALGCILNECFTRRQPWQHSPNFFQVLDPSSQTLQANWNTMTSVLEKLSYTTGVPPTSPRPWCGILYLS